MTNNIQNEDLGSNSGTSTSLPRSIDINLARDRNGTLGRTGGGGGPGGLLQHHKVQSHHRGHNQHQHPLSNAHGQSMTPTSSSLVLNSLAYQVLPVYGDDEDGGQRHKSKQQQSNNNRQQHSSRSFQPLSKNDSHSSLSSKSLSSGSSSGVFSSSQLHASSASSGCKTASGSPNNTATVATPAATSSSATPLITHSVSSPAMLKKHRPPVADDADGHLAYLPGDVIGDRYEIVSTLGEGTFGKVAKARDLEGGQTGQAGQVVALKVIKNIHKYREAAKLEINVLRKLNAKDPAGKNLCVKMFDSFK